MQPTSGSVPPVRAKLALAQSAAAVYIHGGFDDIDDTLDANLYTLDLVLLEWSTTATRLPREGHSMVWHAPLRRLLVFGGVPEEAADASDLVCVDPATGEWLLPATTGFVPKSRLEHACTLSPDHTLMYVSGGTAAGSRSTLDDVLVLEIASWTWLSPLAFAARFQHTLACSGPRLFAYGGLDRLMNHAARAVAWLDLRSHLHGSVVFESAGPLHNPQFVAVPHEPGTAVAIEPPTEAAAVLVFRAAQFEWRACAVTAAPALRLFVHANALWLLGPLADENMHSCVQQVPFSALGIATTLPETLVAADLQALFHSAAHTDYTLTGLALSGEPEPVPVHAAVLMARWPHFARAVSLGMVELLSRTLHIPEPVAWVRGLCEYLYCGAVGGTAGGTAGGMAGGTTGSIDIDTVSGVLVLANTYQLAPLREQCLSMLLPCIPGLSIADLLSLYCRLCQCDDDTLHRAVLAPIQARWGQVVHSNELASLPLPHVTRLLQETFPRETVIDSVPLHPSDSDASGFSSPPWTRQGTPSEQGTPQRGLLHPSLF